MIAAVKRFLGEVTRWASQQPSILAVAVVGSQARGSATASSDVDLIVLVRDPSEFLGDTSWALTFGHPLRHTFETHGQLSVCRVWYQHGLEVEFGFSEERWPHDPGGQAVMADGLKILLDRGPFKGLTGP